MIKLAVFDVDGTLVTKGNRRVPEIGRAHV